jgi:hypothetical protein
LPRNKVWYGNNISGIRSFDRLSEETFWFFHSILLGKKSDMDDIAMAIEKIHKNAEKIKGNVQ